MQILKAFKFELIPNGAQVCKMKQFCGCSRFVFNRALAYQNEQYQKDNSFKFSYAKIANLLPEWKRELVWLKDCHSQVLQQSLKDLEASFKNFFAKRSDFPKFKRKGEKDSFRFPQGCKLEQHNNRIYLPKIGWVRYRNSRAISGSLKNVTVSQKCGKWYVSIQTEWETETPAPNGGEVGIDMGIVRFATLSNGEYFEPINAFKNLKGKLAKLQKRFKNKTKFSKNWQKLRAKIAKLHHKISNIRKNYLHQISSQISQNHAIVYVEDLQVANMSKSAKGDVEQHGKNVKQKSGLNRAILDQSWAEFRRQLAYKLAWNGGSLFAVPPQNTSRCCPNCGHTTKDNRQTQANFECVECGYQNNADVVGAINMLKRGQAIQAA
ncbi:transposase [Kingella kingae]|uniref:RNA-guided endonuclease InsQ/TnpB family protein n=1 Tax=Kingella kingae TaxID=504 RepID=UPI00050A2463|nr:RNA-guided endonuclease TnpB family protein [Kingella kingae]MDK4525439.1 transposase [Kingella kingae]MDK4531464.1 transposase [Kingella kingae]MDK4536490.1 transposase [Kingella kingae]MDK4538863.1 transposase [Kingella kingae]MDK4546119.1 transposase [Kingella kingae]